MLQSALFSPSLHAPVSEQTYSIRAEFTTRWRSLSRELAEDTIILKKLIISPFLSRSVPVLLSLTEIPLMNNPLCLKAGTRKLLLPLNDQDSLQASSPHFLAIL